MNWEKDYSSINKKLWNARTPYHVRSAFYDVKGFLEGNNTLTPIEIPLLGELKNKSLLHLQCHFGLDTLSLSRIGAQVTGVDFSEEAIAEAKSLAVKAALPASFLCCDLFDLPLHLDQKFDIVFTSYGTIGWLPDLNRWAAIVAKYLRPGGLFVMAEFHPVVWMFDNDFKKIQYRYFRSEPIVENESSTYADVNASLNLESVTWNHGLSEVISSLLGVGLKLTSFREYDFSPYNCFANMVESATGIFRLDGMEDKIPMVYSLTAERPLT